MQGPRVTQAALERSAGMFFRSSGTQAANMTSGWKDVIGVPIDL